MRCEKVVFFAPGKVPVSHVFFAVFLKLTHLLNDFESKPTEILTHFAPTDILAEITKCWHLPWGEFHPFSTFGPIWTLGVSGSLWGSVCKSGETLGSQDGTRWSQDGQRWRQTDRIYKKKLPINRLWRPNISSSSSGSGSSSSSSSSSSSK